MYGIKPRGGPLRLHYDPGDPDNVAAVRGVAGSMLRVAERDFEHGFDSGLAVCGGPERNLWAARRKGWLSPADVREVNRLLERLCALFEQGKAPERARLHVLSFVLAPVEARAGRRGSTPPGDDRR